jgi:Uma2 family endonuclease
MGCEEDRVNMRAQFLPAPNGPDNPEPANLHCARRWLAGGPPGPSDIFLSIEVANSSARYDAGPKLRAYARAGIREYWIVNLSENAVEIYRRPVGESYADHFRCERSDQVAPAAFSDRPIAVADILP